MDNIQKTLQFFDKKTAFVYLATGKKKSRPFIMGKLLWEGGLIFTVKTTKANFSITFGIEYVENIEILSKTSIKISLN